MSDRDTRHTRHAIKEPGLPADRAARLLRATRVPHGPERNEAIDWAFAALPGSRAARRLRIERLIQEHDWASADALLARALHDRPADAALLRLSAESLLGQGEFESAASAAQRALARRPEHGATLLTSARAAAARGDAAGAIAFARRAEERASQRDRARELLCEMLLEQGFAARASDVLGRIERPSAPLRARVLAAQGRLFEATEVLERGLAEESRAARDGDVRSRIIFDLLDLLERIGAEDRVRATIALALESARDEPGLALRAAAASIALGEPRRAISAVRSLRHGAHRGRALAVITVAAAAMGRERLAARALDRMRRTASLPDPAWSADLWRRATAAAIAREISVPQPLPAPRPGSVLEPVLMRTIEVLVTQPQDDARRRHLALCTREIEQLHAAA